MKEHFLWYLNMGLGLSARMHFDDCAEFACSFLQNYTVKWLDNTNINSQGPSEQESVEKMSKPKNTFYECLNMGCGLMIGLDWLYFSPKLYSKITW